MIGIYKITSPSGKVYIGQSWDIDKRKSDYKYVQCHKQLKLYNSLIKYGWDKHVFEIVHELPNDVTQEVMNKYEVLYWRLYKDCGIKVLNLKEPGSNGKLSRESIEKGVATRKERWKPISEQTREKMKDSHKGQESWMKGKNHSKETKGKIREANIKRMKNGWLSPKRKPVYRYDIINRTLFIYDKLTDISSPFSCMNIGKWCRENTYIKYDNFIWSYNIIDPINIDDILINIKTIRKNDKKIFHKA